MILQFHDRNTQQRRREIDKLASIRELWDKLVEILPIFYNPEMNITGDEQLVAFRVKCLFRQNYKTSQVRFKMFGAL